MVNISISPLGPSVIEYSDLSVNTLYDVVAPPIGLLSTAGRTFLLTEYDQAIFFNESSEKTFLVDRALLDSPEARYALSERTVVLQNTA